MGVADMSAWVLAAVLIVVAVTLLFAELRPTSAEKTYLRLEGARKIGAGIFLILFSVTALQSGRWYLVLAALLAIAAAALYLAVEKPHRRVA